MYGNCDFSSYPQPDELPFHAGFQVIRTEKFGNEVHVYYPIEKNTEITNEKDPKWLSHGEKTLKGLLMLSTGKFYGENEMGPQKILRQLKGLKIGVMQNGQLTN